MEEGCKERQNRLAGYALHSTHEYTIIICSLIKLLICPMLTALSPAIVESSKWSRFGLHNVGKEKIAQVRL